MTTKPRKITMPPRWLRPANPYPLIRDTATSSYPLSVGQERLWWQRQQDSSHDEYHIHGGWRLPGGLDQAALATALAALVRRHQILRTRFVLRPDGTTAQEVLDDVEIQVRRAGKQWRPAIDRAATEPFDLARPPLFRVVSAELDDGAALYIVLHHIVTDRWSMDVLPRDLFAFYAAALAGRPAELPDLLVQYGDYAVWQRRYLTPDSLLTWWTTTLAGHERPELPLDRPRPAIAGRTGASLGADLSETATAALTALAWRARATPFIVVMAALASTLGDFTGQPDVVVGAIVSDRPDNRLRDLIGFFINTVPVRIDLSAPGLTFRDAITVTRDAWMAADAHQDVPFEQIVGALRAGADGRRQPVFDVAVNHGGDWTSLTELPDAPAWWHPDVPETARFDLSLTTALVDGRLRATFRYRPDLYDRAPIAALADRYARLVERAAAEPDRPLAEFDLVPGDELDRSHRHNDPAGAPAATVVELFQRQAASRPDAPAVVAADGELTYRELNQRANRLAGQLRTLGAGPERVIGVCLDHGVDRLVVLLAVAKSGAAYLPLDPGFPADRLRFLLADSGAVLTIVSRSLRGSLPAGIGPLLEADGEIPGLAGTEAADPPPAAGPGNLAYLISTSGSTGTPKLVAVPHRALTRLVAGAGSYLEVGPGTTFVQAGPLTFDVAVLEWTPLAHGGRVAVTDTGPLLDDLETVVREHGVTTLKLVSPQLDVLVERGIGSLAGLRQLVVGGDVVTPASFTAARELLPGCRVIASYGPTESTVLATVYDGTGSGGRAGAHRVPIGHAIPHTRVYILDRHLRHASLGMRGEIYLAGDGLARGYHRRPGLTAQAFVPDPYGPPGSRMYRTGDTGRYLADGDIDFLGRADRQVKIRGFRIETGEVEYALLRYPGITSAVVIRAETETGPCLAAYVVASAPPDRDELRRALRSALPAYLVPDHIVTLPRMPLTAHNKIDRAALPPIAVAASGPEPGTAPESGLAGRVGQAWSQALGRAIPADADFFERGGHSLLVPRATAAVRRLLGREVPLRLMLEHRTPAAYAAALVKESSLDLGAATREHRLVQRTWRSRRLGGDRRVDLFVAATGPDAAVERALVVLDGAEFVDIMRLPAVLDRLVVAGRIPPTAAAFLSPADWSARRTELLDDAYTDVLAGELVPYLREWLGGRWRAERATALGASLGAVVALRAALRRPDCFDGAVALSGPLTEHQLFPDPPPYGPPPYGPPARLFLAAGLDEAGIALDDGFNLLEATQKTAEELTGQGHAVRFERGEGGHTYAAWEAQLPDAVAWVLTH
jgi:amino acid adenylation domain-containing protein